MMPHWMTNQDGANGTQQALKPLVVLDESKLTDYERNMLRVDGFHVPVSWADLIEACQPQYLTHQQVEEKFRAS